MMVHEPSTTLARGATIDHNEDPGAPSKGYNLEEAECHGDIHTMFYLRILFYLTGLIQTRVAFELLLPLDVTCPR